MPIRLCPTWKVRRDSFPSQFCPMSQCPRKKFPGVPAGKVRPHGCEGAHSLPVVFTPVLHALSKISHRWIERRFETFCHVLHKWSRVLFVGQSFQWIKKSGGEPAFRTASGRVLSPSFRRPFDGVWGTRSLPLPVLTSIPRFEMRRTRWIFCLVFYA